VDSYQTVFAGIVICSPRPSFAQGIACRLPRRGHGVADACNISITELDIDCTDVFLQVFAALGTGIGTISFPWQAARRA